MQTLPDYLQSDLDIVFVGINPGAYSAKLGLYFATARNRFWPALNHSGIILSGHDLGPGDEARMNRVGVGFTDVVKRPSSSASSLRAADYRQDAPTLKANLLKYQPLVVCFNGLTAYKNYLRYAEGTKVSPALGAQERRIGTSRIFVVPSSSPANAAYSLEVLADWYVRLGEYRDRTKIQRNG